jgi:two-component sensor histidine kinase
MAIERQRIEGTLRAALQQQEILLQELDHRVSNSLQLVISMLHLQAGTTDDPNVKQQLQEASSRIGAIARAHRRLQSRGQDGLIELAGYLGEVCDDLSTLLGMCRFEDTLSGPAALPTNRAVSVAIMLTELVTNAAKHAYPDGTSGAIQVRLEPLGAGGLRLKVVDQGTGLPEGFVPSAGSGLGMRIALALTQQLGGTLDIRGMPGHGTEVELALPPATNPNL